jgi:hypothetical protein
VIEMGKTSAAVKNRYAAKNYERITILVKKGEKDKSKEAAAQGGETLTGYLLARFREERGKV